MTENKLNDTENKILKALIEAGKELCYSEVRQICKLTDPTCSKYLNKLSHNKYIHRRESRMKNEYPHPVFYKVKNDINTFKMLVNEFIESSFFHSSNYCQNMISPSLLRKIEQTWDIEQFPSKTVIDKPDVFTEENILEILRLSPTALKKSLYDPLEGTNSERFEEMLLASFILDINTRAYPDYEFKLKMSVEFHRQGKEPVLKLCESCIFSIMPSEY